MIFLQEKFYNQTRTKRLICRFLSNIYSLPSDIFASVKSSTRYEFSRYIVAEEHLKAWIKESVLKSPNNSITKENWFFFLLCEIITDM